MKIAGACLVAMLLVGCSSESGDEAAEDTVVATTAPTSTTESDGVLDLGETFTTESGSDLTVYEFRAATPTDDSLPEGFQWASVDLETCNGSGITGPIGSTAWQLTAGHEQIDTSTDTTDGALTPVFDPTSSIAEGDCLRGWALFQVPTGLTVEAVVFTKVASGADPEWTL